MEVDPSFGPLYLVFVYMCTLGVTNVVTANFVESTRSSTACYRDLRVAEAMSNKEVSVNHTKVIFTSVANGGLIDAERMASMRGALPNRADVRTCTE